MEDKVTMFLDQTKTEELVSALNERHEKQIQDAIHATYFGTTTTKVVATRVRTKPLPGESQV